MKKTRPTLLGVIHIVFVSLLLLGNNVLAEKYKNPLFKTNDRVCFVGNSITFGGEFHHNILLYQLTRFPGENVNFYNCGIAGNSVAGVLARMDTDILINQPTHAILMIGMNDVARYLYGPKISYNVDTLRMREEALTLYKSNLEKLVRIFISNKVQLTLQKPSIYDQTAMLPTANNLGVNDALKNCADFIETLAVKYKLSVVDYWSIMHQINIEQQKNDPSFTLISQDRVHPQSTGHFIMAYQYLKTFQGPQYVSKIFISKNQKRINDLCQNCYVSKVHWSSKELIFSVFEKSLPFPIVSNQVKALELVPFVADLNQEILQVTELINGKYELLIDNKSIGSFTSIQLKEGINLALIQETPQYQQALKVREELDKLWQYEAKLRSLKFVEYLSDFQKYNGKVKTNQIRQKLDSVYSIQKKSSANWILSKVDEYVANKSSENLYKSNSEALRKEALKQAQPTVHTFKLILKK